MVVEEEEGGGIVQNKQLSHGDGNGNESSLPLKEMQTGASALGEEEEEVVVEVEVVDGTATTTTQEDEQQHHIGGVCVEEIEPFPVSCKKKKDEKEEKTEVAQVAVVPQTAAAGDEKDAAAAVVVGVLPSPCQTTSLPPPLPLKPTTNTTTTTTTNDRWWFEVSSHTQRVHFHAAPDRSTPLLLSMPLESLIVSEAPAMTETLAAVHRQLLEKQQKQHKNASSVSVAVVGGVGPIAVDLSIVSSIEELQSAISSAQLFAREWKELSSSTRSRLYCKVLQSPLDDAADSATAEAAAEGAFGTTKERFLEGGAGGGGVAAAAAANLKLPVGAEWRKVRIRYVRHGKEVVYDQAIQFGCCCTEGEAEEEEDGSGSEESTEKKKNKISLPPPPTLEQPPNGDHHPSHPHHHHHHHKKCLPNANDTEPTSSPRKQQEAEKEENNPQQLIIISRLCLNCLSPVPHTAALPLDAVLDDGAWSLFCKPDCFKKYQVKTSGVAARRALFKRELGVCVTCGLDCTALIRRLQAIERGSKGWRDRRRTTLRLHYSDFMQRAGVKAVDALIERATAGRAWQADHVIPVYAGGGQCGVDNLRTLCTACHQGVTRGQAKERGAARRAAKSTAAALAAAKGVNATPRRRVKRERGEYMDDSEDGGGGAGKKMKCKKKGGGGVGKKSSISTSAAAAAVRRGERVHVIVEEEEEEEDGIIEKVVETEKDDAMIIDLTDLID